MTFAKGLGNGVAIGGVVARAEVMGRFTANSTSTFGGNPLSTAAASATLDYVLAHDLQANAATVGVRLLEGLRALPERCAAVGQVRGKGLMIGIELVEPGTTTPAPALAARVLEETRKDGLLIGKGIMRPKQCARTGSGGHDGAWTGETRLLAGRSSDGGGGAARLGRHNRRGGR